MLLGRIVSLGGLVLMVAIAFSISENRRRIDWRLVAVGIGLQIIFGLLILKPEAGQKVFHLANAVINRLIGFSNHGAQFLFGKLVTDYQMGAIVAFQVLPIIIFVSSLAAVLYHFGIIQFVVKIMAKMMHRTMRISGAESLSAALFVFMGIEAITAIRAYIEKMTRSELFTLMTGFMATIAGSVMAAYVSFGAKAGHLLVASIISAPAAILISKIMIPEVETPLTKGEVRLETKRSSVNVIDAAATGASEGLKLAVNIGAMLLAFVALIYMLNTLLAFIHQGINAILGSHQLPEQFKSLHGLFGYLFSPLAFVMGVPWQDCLQVGQLLGTKVVLNEFLAYRDLQVMMAQLSPRSVVVATYALCSFANFGSIAILIGGIGGVAPSRKKEVVKLGLKALVAGNLAGFMTATIAGILT